MRKIAIISFFSIFVLASVSFAQERNAPDFEETDITIFNQDEVVEGDFFAHGEIVEILGTINGDLYAVGEKVLINGKINGDVLAAGGQVIMSGEVTHDVRVAGGQVIINGTVCRNLSIAGGDIHIDAPAQIIGNFVGWGGNVIVVGPIQGNVRLGAGNATIQSIINGNVDVTSSQFELGPKAIIQGKLHKNTIPLSKKNVSDTTKNFFIFLKILNFISTLIIGLIFVHIFPYLNKRAVQLIQKRPLKSLITGMSILLLMPIIILALMITIVGIPIGFMILALYGIFLYSARLPFMYFVGSFVLQKMNKKVNDGWSFVLGLLIITVLTFIPVISFLTTLFIVLFGLGSLSRALKDSYIEVHKKKIV